MIAITRAVSPAINRCERTHVAFQEIDYQRAVRQHAEYERALERLGATVIRAPALPALPDAVFVEDMAVVFDEIAIIASSGVASRREEAASIAELMKAYRPCTRIEPPGFLEGGDVLRFNRKVYIGVSTRTNTEGVRQVRAALAPFTYDVDAVPVGGCLHLKTACSNLGRDTLLAHGVAEFDRLDVITLPAGEAAAANVLVIGETVLMPAGFPRTRQLLRSRGWRVEELDISELQKAEAGLTCMSIVFEP